MRIWRPDITTVKLDGYNANVLAKQTHYGLTAVTYANRTQAYTKADELKALGIECAVIGRHPWYIRIEGSK
jgi:hypothetical protein